MLFDIFFSVQRKFSIFALAGFTLLWGFLTVLCPGVYALAAMMTMMMMKINAGRHLHVFSETPCRNAYRANCPSDAHNECVDGKREKKTRLRLI